MQNIRWWTRSKLRDVRKNGKLGKRASQTIRVKWFEAGLVGGVDKKKLEPWAFGVLEIAPQKYRMFLNT